MSEFNNWFGVRFPNIQATIDQTNDQESKLLKLCCEEVWQHQQAIIDDLKAQLNNMEACYIEKKKRVDELESVLNEVKEWKSHPAGYEASFGSWGVRDFYRGLAEKSLRGASD